MRRGGGLLLHQSLIFAVIFFLAGLLMSHGAWGRTVRMTLVATAVYAGFLAAGAALARRKGGRR